jgi:hypothetical protein
VPIPMSALGQKQTCAPQNVISALPPKSDRESGFLRKVMSALSPKADMCSARAHVRFGPKADSCGAAKKALFDHLIGALLERQGHVEAERLRSLEIDDEFKLGWNLDRQFPRTRTF